MNKSSLFSTLPGLVVLFAIMITAAYFGVTLLAALLLLALVLCALSRLWSRSVLKKTEVSIAESGVACHAGESFDLTLCVRSRSFFPLIWLDVALPLVSGDRARIVREGDDPKKIIQLPYESPLTALCERFVWLLWQQEIICTERMTALERGVIALERASLQAGDGLGLAACQRWTQLEQVCRVTVYPRLYDVDVSSFLRLVQDTEAGSRGQTEDVTLLRASRPYQHGDPMRRINWRRLAMSGVMETNQYEMITPGCISFVLDLSSFGYEEIVGQDAATKSGGVVRHAVHNVQMEKMISVIASVIRALYERTLRFALVIPGYGDCDAVICRPGTGETAYMQAMEALAQIHYRGGEAKLPMEELQRLRRKLGAVHLCAMTDERAEIDRMEMLGLAHVRSIACIRQARDEEGISSCLLLEQLMLSAGGEGGAA